MSWRASSGNGPERTWRTTASPSPRFTAPRNSRRHSLIRIAASLSHAARGWDLPHGDRSAQEIRSRSLITTASNPGCRDRESRISSGVIGGCRFRFAISTTA